MQEKLIEIIHKLDTNQEVAAAEFKNMNATLGRLENFFSGPFFEKEVAHRFRLPFYFRA